MKIDEAILVLENHISPYDGCKADNEANQAIRLAVDSLEVIKSLMSMRDNALRLYEVEDGNSDYSYGRKQVLGTVHSDLEELLEVFKEAENEIN